jgi:hypothetical protein
MARSSVRNHQLSLDAVPDDRFAEPSDRRKKLEDVAGAPLKADLTRNKVAEDSEPRKKIADSPELIASARFTGAAIERARDLASIPRKVAASAIGFDEQRWSRMVNGAPADQPSTARLMLLGPKFIRHYQSEINKWPGVRRELVVDVFGLAADLAMACDL